MRSALLIAAAITVAERPSAEPMPPELRALFEPPPSGHLAEPRPPSRVSYTLGPAVSRCDDDAELALIRRLPPESIQRTLRLNHGRFRGCFTSARVLQEPTRLTLRFTIGEGGRVRGSVVEEAVQPTLAACLVAALAEVRFAAPPSSEPIAVTYPLWVTDRPSPPIEIMPPPTPRPMLRP